MKWIIIKSGAPFENRYFNSIDEAKNFLTFKFPKRRFKKDEFLWQCYLVGAKFLFIELINPNDL